MSTPASKSWIWPWLRGLRGLKLRTKSCNYNSLTYRPKTWTASHVTAVTAPNFYWENSWSSRGIWFAPRLKPLPTWQHACMAGPCILYTCVNAQCGPVVNTLIKLTFIVGKLSCELPFVMCRCAVKKSPCPMVQWIGAQWCLKWLPFRPLTLSSIVYRPLTANKVDQ